MSTYFTIRHCDTHEGLGFGGPLDRQKALGVLLTRPTLVKSEWYVTAWSKGDDGEDDEIEAQMSADEFVHVQGRV